MAQLNTRIALRNDSAERWLEHSTEVLAKGEVGVEFTADGTTKIKIGDGVKTWADLDYVGGEGTATNVFEVIPNEGESHIEAINRVAGDTALANGDVAYVKEAIYTDAANEANNKYSYTGYVYNNGNWAAMDGNYSADNIYFDEDMLVTTNIGYITTTNGSGTIPSAGKNLTQVFEAMFVQEQQPTITPPSVSLTFSQAKAYEVGTVVTPSYTTSLNAGKYSFGPETGVVAVATDNTSTGFTVTDTNGNTSVDLSGSFEAFTVEESTNYKITSVVNHSAGAQPLTNKGNNSSKSAIIAGTKSKTSSAVTGYRAWFSGYVGADRVISTTDNADGSKTLLATSADIRALKSTNGSFDDKLTTQQMQQIIFAAPEGLVSSISISNATNGAPLTVYKTTGIEVEGANGFASAPYDVFFTNSAVPESGESKWNIKVTKA